LAVFFAGFQIADVLAPARVAKIVRTEEAAEHPSAQIISINRTGS
jgi:hypothetical protein